MGGTEPGNRRGASREGGRWGSGAGRAGRKCPGCWAEAGLSAPCPSPAGRALPERRGGAQRAPPRLPRLRLPSLRAEPRGRVSAGAAELRAGLGRARAGRAGTGDPACVGGGGLLHPSPAGRWCPRPPTPRPEPGPAVPSRTLAGPGRAGASRLWMRSGGGRPQVAHGGRWTRACTGLCRGRSVCVPNYMVEWLSPPFCT